MDCLLESALGSFRKFVRNKRETNGYDRLVIRLFSKLLSRPPEAEKQVFLQEIAANLKAMELESDPVDSAGIAFFPLRIWVEAKLRGISFAEASRQVYPAPDQELIDTYRRLAPPEL